MSVKNSLLALLAEEPTHGYGLKSNFEKSTAGTWPLNVGQVYTTLARLERDGFAQPEGNGEGNRQTWRITEEGRAALTGWYTQPVPADPPARDELAIKVLLALAADSADVQQVLHAQRVATMELLQRYTREKREADSDQNLSWVLLLDSLVLKAEAELKWIDLCEMRLNRRDG